MGPTASGKTEVALRLAEVLPLEIISVDSAMVYRGMDIGTAKPDAETLRKVPHSLVDILDPEDTYSAGHFVRDALREIARVLNAGRVPLLVGGTMMYFRALVSGIATLPEADRNVRQQIDTEAAVSSWPQMHQQLAAIDPEAAARIDPHDSQRIQRAIEVYRLSGRTLSELQDMAPSQDQGNVGHSYLRIALLPSSRPELHQRIALRLQRMIALDLVAEVRRLMARPNLTRGHASMKSVGYRQIWSHLAGELSLEVATDKTLYATRQLCKRQLTWLRGDSSLNVIDPLEKQHFASILALLNRHLAE